MAILASFPDFNFAEAHVHEPYLRVGLRTVHRDEEYVVIAVVSQLHVLKYSVGGACGVG